MSKPPYRPRNLVLLTRTLMHRDQRSVYQIAKDSGIPFYWLRKFRTGETVEPGANRVQKLYEHLSNKHLVK